MIKIKWNRKKITKIPKKNHPTVILKQNGIFGRADLKTFKIQPVCLILVKSLGAHKE